MKKKLIGLLLSVTMLVAVVGSASANTFVSGSLAMNTIGQAYNPSTSTSTVLYCPLPTESPTAYTDIYVYGYSIGHPVVGPNCLSGNMSACASPCYVYKTGGGSTCNSGAGSGLATAGVFALDVGTPNLNALNILQVGLAPSFGGGYNVLFGYALVHN